MLSIAKLGAARGADYYLDRVASGAEDYYVRGKEAPGRWVGESAASLGLTGEVDPEALRAVLAARHPATGTTLVGQLRANRVPGFDLTFSAPKGVSLLFAFGGEQMSAAVRDAHEVAVDAVMGWLDAEACRVRLGRNGVDQQRGSGWVAAAFRHRSSRAGDPQLHTHVVVANLTQGPDGQWRSLDGRELYRVLKTGGTLYQAVLRHELNERGLGLRWELRGNGLAELADVPRAVLRHFSRRSVDIEAHLAAVGESGSKAAEVAALATRHGKEAVDERTLAQRWAARLAELELPAEHITAAVRTETRPRASGEQIESIAVELLGAEGLTRDDASFTGLDVLRGVAARLERGGTVEELTALAAQVLDRGEVVPLLPTGSTAPRRAARRYSTVELLAVEAALLDTAVAGRHAGVGVVEPAVADLTLAGATLSGEQARVVRGLLGDGNQVDVVVGPAGSGKTRALATAYRAWAAAGYEVIGAAVAARTAANLQSDTGIPSRSLARLEHGLDTGTRPLPAGAVVVVDEAAMAGTRQLARLVDAVRAADGKLVLVGDPHQVPEIEAGGAFVGLARRLDAIQLDTNQRQQHPWEVTAVAELRAGDVAAALAAYDAHGRVLYAADTIDAAGQLADAWWATAEPELRATPTEPGESILLATLRRDVRLLNAHARGRLLDAGLLAGPSLDVDLGHGRQRSFAVGDIVLAMDNDYHGSGLLNGTRGVVVALDPHRGELAVLADGRRYTVPAGYLRAGHLDYGYALTITKAQGITVDHAYVLGGNTLYRESAYTAMSRGRWSNVLVAVGDTLLHDPAHEHSHPQVTAEPPPIESQRAALERSRAKRLAHDTPTDLIPDDSAAHPRGDLAHLRGQAAAVAARIAPEPGREGSVEHDAWRAAHQEDLTRLDALRLAAAARRSGLLRVVAGLDRDSAPGYLLDLLGAPPADRQQRGEWNRAAARVEAYRETYHVRAANGLGAAPSDADPQRAASYAATARDVAVTAARLGHDRYADLRALHDIELAALVDAGRAVHHDAPPPAPASTRDTAAERRELHARLVRGELSEAAQVDAVIELVRLDSTLREHATAERARQRYLDEHAHTLDQAQAAEAELDARDRQLALEIDTSETGIELDMTY